MWCEHEAHQLQSSQSAHASFARQLADRDAQKHSRNTWWLIGSVPVGMSHSDSAHCLVPALLVCLQRGLQLPVGWRQLQADRQSQVRIPPDGRQVCRPLLGPATKTTIEVFMFESISGSDALCGPRPAKSNSTDHWCPRRSWMPTCLVLGVAAAMHARAGQRCGHGDAMRRTRDC